MSTDLPDSGRKGPVLFDTVSNSVIWSGEDPLPGMHAPAWDAAGLSAAIATTSGDPRKYLLAVIDREGNLVTTTDLGKSFDEVYIGEFSWSPDSSKVAIWVDARTKETDGKLEVLEVLDVLSGVVTNYCVRGQYEFNRSPIWSPDGSKLIVDHGPSDAFAQEVVVDLSSASAAELGTPGVVLAWLQGSEVP